MTRQDDNIRKRIESSEKFVPFTPSAWACPDDPAGGKVGRAVCGGELDRPPVAGSINVIQQEVQCWASLGI